MMEPWNKCQECGKFIPYDDFLSKKAVHKLGEPSSYFGEETWETYCKNHSEKVT